MTQDDKDNHITETKKDPQRIRKDDDKRWGLDGVPKAPDRDPTADYRRAATYHDEGWAPIKAAGMHGVSSSNQLTSLCLAVVLSGCSSIVHGFYRIVSSFIQ